MFQTIGGHHRRTGGRRGRGGSGPQQLLTKPSTAQKVTFKAVSIIREHWPNGWFIKYANTKDLNVILPRENCTLELLGNAYEIQVINQLTNICSKPTLMSRATGWGLVVECFLDL